MTLFLAFGGDDHHHLPSFQFRTLFDSAVFLEVRLEPLQQALPEFLVHHFTATEAHRDLGLVPVTQETYQVAKLYLIIPFFRRWTKLDFLDLHLLLFLLGSMLFLVQLEQEFAVVHYAANRRLGLGSDFHQIQVRLEGDLLCFVQRHDAHLLAVGPDQSNLARCDLVVDARLFFSSDNSALQNTAAAARVLGDESFHQRLNGEGTQVFTLTRAHGHCTVFHFLIPYDQEIGNLL